MSDTATQRCSGISSNPDISGPGVRVALYLQSLLSVVLVRFSPQDAPGAYWSMTSTAFSLIISSIVTSAQGQISLLDAIVVVYVLLLPILASALGLSEIAAPSNHKNPLRSVHSPLLIVANWTRSALTYSFALYVWISAPTFGSGSRECNEATRLIFFGASLPALGSGRYLNLTIWGVFTLLFVYRALKGARTIAIACRALLSSSASQALLKPKGPPRNEVHREIVTRFNFKSRERTTTNRLFRPRQIFHELLQGVMSQIMGWTPSGTGRWYRAYGRTILIALLAAWAIIMTELELALNELVTPNNQWGFGQILPLVLTISPLFSLYEYFLSRRASGPINKSRILRFNVKGGKGLQRPHCEVDSFGEELIEQLGEENIQRRRAPTAFVVVTIAEREQYTTYEHEHEKNPRWNEGFDVKLTDTSTIVIRVFDRKCIDAEWPSLIGFTTILPFSLLPPPVEGEPTPDLTPRQEPKDLETAIDSSSIEVDVPLIREGRTVPEMTIKISLSTDTSLPPTLPYVPPTLVGPQAVHTQTRVGLFKWGNKTVYGRKKETHTTVYQLQ
ncbi:hypothetical protein CPB83DRAFT_849293 [Crepidotus variabilis]|uniref:C2 domain-containing protein n=1 Tax=Crepidotus variabilis TaxID=179855 RepID=A0A9P6JSM1_9AGAR|nr:hypothetical protein CPB83DRAFT_849293 [Crepidotus variabilis]